MRTPHIPSLQHFCRLVDKDSDLIASRLTEISEHPPWLSYRQAIAIARDHLILRTSESDVDRAVARISNKRKRDVIGAACKAFVVYARTCDNRSYADIERHYFGVGRFLFVPVNPFLYGAGPSESVILWPSFWKNLQLSEDQLAVFATILDRTYLNSPDFQGTDLHLIDLGQPRGSRNREARVFQRRDLPTFSDAELKLYIDAFVEAFLEVRRRTARGEAEASQREPTSDTPLFLDRPNQP